MAKGDGDQGADRGKVEASAAKMMGLVEKRADVVVVGGRLPYARQEGFLLAKWLSLLLQHSPSSDTSLVARALQ